MAEKEPPLEDTSTLGVYVFVEALENPQDLIPDELERRDPLGDTAPALASPTDSRKPTEEVKGHL